jgi:putative aldouronate transport system substrate-binding protein
MIKKSISFFIVLCQLVLISNFCLSSELRINIFADNVQIKSDVEPFIINGSVYVPVRAIADAMDIDIEWNPDTKTVTASTGDTQLKMQIGSNTVLINSKKFTMNGQAVIKNGRTFIPVRFFCEAFGADVNWQDSPPTVRIMSGTFSGGLIYKHDGLDVVVGSHQSWPFDENWLFWAYLRETSGEKINLTVIPDKELSTKISLMMASIYSLPDLIHVQDKAIVDKYTDVGALIAIDDYLDIMPNYIEFWNSFSEETRNEYLTRRKSADGKTHFPQVYGCDGLGGVRTWLYRKDIFESFNLKVPETLDEVYDAALMLKELYPSSYPVCLRDGLERINMIGPAFKPCFNYGAYYDFPNKKWSYGAAEPTMLEIIKYFIKLRDAGLIPPDYLTINEKQWEELISTDRGFIMPEYLIRVGFFNKPMKEFNPNYTLAPMTPPRANTAEGQNKVENLNIDNTGYVICNTGDSDRIRRAVKFVDRMYSDEAAELLSWGKEGETYETINGKRRYIVDEYNDPSSKYGAFTHGLYQRLDPEAFRSAFFDGLSSIADITNSHIEEKTNPAYWLDLNNEDIKRISGIKADINMYTEEMLSKFLYNTEPLSNWDSFQAKLKELGVEELLEAYDTAYKQVSGQ